MPGVGVFVGLYDRAGSIAVLPPDPLVDNLTAYNQLAGYPGQPRPPQYGSCWATDIHGLVDTGTGSLGQCAVFDGSSALGLPYGEHSPLNISGAIDFTMRFRFKITTAPVTGELGIMFSVGRESGQCIKLYVTQGSGSRIYVQAECRDSADSIFYVTAYNYTGAGSETLSLDTWYTCVLRRDNATNGYDIDILEAPLFSAHANNHTTANGLKPVTSAANGFNELLRAGMQWDNTNGWNKGFIGNLEGLYVYSGYRATDDEVATMGGGFDPLSLLTGATVILLSKPQAFQTHNKTGTSANVEISGCLNGNDQSLTDIQYNWDGTWVDAVATVDNTKRTFKATVTITETVATPAGRQRTLQVRLKNATSVTKSIAYVGIGYVFSVSGQSNAAGAFTSLQPYAPSNGLKGGLYKPDYGIVELADPTHSPYDCWIDASTESQGGGSVWPLFAALWADRTGYPVMIVATARSGAVIGANVQGSGYAGWAPNAGLYRYGSCSQYDSLKRRILQLTGGVTANLMMEGESDAGLNVSSADYQTRLVAFADQLHTDTGAVTVASLLQDCVALTTTQENNIRNGITGAAGATVNVKVGPDLSDIVTDDSFHMHQSSKAVTVAGRFDTTLAGLGFAV